MRQGDSAPADPAAAVKCDLSGEVLRTFGSLRFGATGWSMLPSIWPGDTLVVERAGADQLQVGEVALVGREDRLCAHRVVSWAEDAGNPCGITYLITQGDAMPAPDRPVAADEVLGRVAYVIRAGKCISVPTNLNLGEQLVARIIRRSFLAARALVYLHRTVGIAEKSGPKESVLPCQG
jgi:signal peptidase I